MPHHRVHAGDEEVRAPLLTGTSADTDSDEGTAAPSLNCRVILKLLNWLFYRQRDENTTLCTLILTFLRCDICSCNSRPNAFLFLVSFFEPIVSIILLKDALLRKNTRISATFAPLYFLQLQIADVQQMLIVLYNGSSK